MRPRNPHRRFLTNIATPLSALAIGILQLVPNALAAPVNDNFAAAIALTGATGTQTGTDNVDATLEVGESNPGAINTVWFKWTSAIAGYFTIRTTGSRTPGAGEWDAILGIYTGASVDALTPFGGPPQDTGYDETMTVTVAADTTYFIQTAGYGNDVAANILLNWSFSPTTACDMLTFGPGASITGTDIIWTVPFGTSESEIAALAPSFTMSTGATCDQPNGGTPPTPPLSTTAAVPYKVTSEDASTSKNYFVTVTVAGSTTWGAVANDTLNGDSTAFVASDVLTNGTAAAAVTNGIGGTVNGVVFQSCTHYTYPSFTYGSSSISLAWTSPNNGYGAPGNAYGHFGYEGDGGTGTKLLLTGGGDVGGNGVITLGSLVSGHTYQVQIWSSTWNQTFRTGTSIAGTALQIGQPSGTLSQNIVGTFVASGTNQPIVWSGIAPTAISLRDLTGGSGATTYTGWATAHGVVGGVNDDSNQDGVQNGIAYFMNATGDATLPGLGADHKITWTNGGNIPSSAYGTQFVVQTSANLMDWTPVSNDGSDANLDNTEGSLTYTLTPGAGKLFVRLVVTPN